MWMDQVVVNIELFLEATPEAVAAWQAKCWAKLKAASDTLVNAQQAALASAKFNATMNTPLTGQNPQKNLATMRNEVKKGCISLMTYQHFDQFRAISTSLTKADNGLPISEVDINQAWDQGPYVRFFEKAFEWDEMT
jgi:hypothetical protein